MLKRGLGQSGVVVGRMQQASQAGQLGAGGKRLAVTEVLGVVAGVLRYYRAARHASESRPGVR